MNLGNLQRTPNPKMMLLCKKSAHGARCEQVYMMLPRRSQGSTLENHMHFLANSSTVASQPNPVSPVHMASTSQTASSSGRAMTTQPKLQKALHAPSRNNEADNTCCAGYVASQILTAVSETLLQTRRFIS